MRPRLHLDFETRSTLDLPKVGVHRYATHPTTEPWFGCWTIDNEPVDTWYPGQDCPIEIRAHIAAGHPVVGHNVGFEWHIIEHILANRHGWPRIPFEQLDCTAARAAAMSLPRSLDGAASALKLDVQKDSAGRRLMLQMARPRRIDPATGKIEWWDTPDRVERLRAYCATDVVVERELDHLLRPLSEDERRVWLFDARMNQRGVAVDMRLVKHAGLVLEESLRQYNVELELLTEGKASTVNKVVGIKDWVRSRGFDLAKLDKQVVRDTLADSSIPPDVRRVLKIRQEAGKSSTAKLLAFVQRTSDDRRMRENLMYHGASTGRWTGKGVQLQNLPRPEMKKGAVAEAIEVLRDAQLSTEDKLQRIEMFYGPVPSVVADCLRGCIVAGKGKKLYVSDFAAIEARVLAWAAQQKDLVQLFASGGKVYETMAAMIFRCAIEDIARDSFERQLGKKTVLGCGYGMGAEKFLDTCAKDGIVITLEMAEHAVATYRELYARIRAFWYELEDAAVAAVREPGRVFRAGPIRFASDNAWLRYGLPSGRKLWFREPRVEMGMTPWGKRKEQVSFMCTNPVTKQWTRQRTYGGEICENVVQAMARDLLAHGMLSIEERFGMEMVLSVHDEVVFEADENCSVTVDEFEAALTSLPAWAKGCPVAAADGYTASRYRK